MNNASTIARPYLATLGTPHDVTVHELRLESFFPADAVSRQWFEAQAPRG